jgi:hypothetical protein
MSAKTHLEARKAKHKACEAQLEEAIFHASSRDQEIAEIKHRKLHLKDEITAFEAKLRSTAYA